MGLINPASAVVTTSGIAQTKSGQLTVPLVDSGGQITNITATGAVGDGATNDTTAFTTAIATATEIFLPSRHVFSPTTLTKNNLRYRGVHGLTTVQLVGQGGGPNVSLLSMSNSNVTFEDIVFDGNGASIGSGNYWSGLINLGAGAYQITFRRCVFQNTARSAVYGNGLSYNRVVTDAAMTSGSTTLTSATAAFVAGDVGRTVVVMGAGPGPASRPAAAGGLTTTISSVTNGTTAVLAAAATATVAGATAYIGISTGSPIAGVVFDDCRWTGIGNAGAGAGGAGVMLEQNIVDCELRHARAYGRLTSNLLKLKGDVISNKGFGVLNADIDYSSVTTVDATYSALGLEFWSGSYNSRVTHVNVRGPDTPPVAGAIWGISCGDARDSVWSNITILGGASNQAMQYGIETAECPGLQLSNFSIYSVDVGMNSTNNQPSPSSVQNIGPGKIQNCYDYGFVTDSGPEGIDFHDVVIIDGGTRYVYLSQNNAISKRLMLRNVRCYIKDQTRLDPSNSINALYVQGGARTDYVPVDFGDFVVAPYPGGTSTVGLTLAYINNPSGARIHDGDYDGGRPSDGAAAVTYGVAGYTNGLTFQRNRVRNVTYAGFQDDNTGPSLISDNDMGAITWANQSPTIAAGAGAGTTPPSPVGVVAAASTHLRGTLTAGTGTTPAAAAIWTVTFRQNLPVAPVAVKVFANGPHAAALANWYATNISATGFTINCSVAPAASQANTFYELGFIVELP